MLFRKRALNRLKLHAYPVDRAPCDRPRNHYPVHETRETSRETTRFFRSHLPIFSGCATQCGQMRPKETKIMSISRLFVRCRTASASFFLQYPISNSIYDWLCATLLQVACDLLVGSMRPNFLKNQTNAIDLYLSPYQHQIPWTGPQLTMVGM